MVSPRTRECVDLLVWQLLPCWVDVLSLALALRPAWAVLSQGRTTVGVQCTCLHSGTHDIWEPPTLFRVTLTPFPVLCRYVPIPKVLPEERLLFMPLPVRGLFRCVARYGYTDAVDQVWRGPARNPWASCLLI